MKFKTSRAALLEALASVVGVVERRQTLPILSNVQLETKEAAVLITGTDLEIQVVSKAEGQVTAPGKTTIPARKLYDICRSLAEGADISIDVGGDKASVRSGRSRYSLSCLPAGEFPAMDTVKDALTLTLPAKEMFDLIAKTEFAMAQQDVRYYLNGLCLEVAPKRVRAVATDGHRLALAEKIIDTGFKDTTQYLIPRKAVGELRRLVEGHDGDVTLKLARGQFAIKVGSVALTSKLIDGRFPDYERVLPDLTDKVIEADCGNVKRALARAAILSNEKFRGIRCTLSKNKLVLEAQNPEHEQATEEVDVSFDGGDIEIGFNVNYLIDAIGAIKTETFKLSLKNGESSGMIFPSDGMDSRYVVMPMRL